jgi:PAP2 superfamily protein
MGFWAKLILALYLLVIVGFGSFVSTKIPDVDLTLFFYMNGFDPLNASGFAALYVCFLGCRPSRKALYLSFVLSAILELAYQTVILSPETDLRTHILTLGGGVGAAGLMSMVGLYFFESDPVRKRRISIWLMSGLCLALYPLASTKAIATLSMMTPEVLDTHAYRFEGSPGFFPAQVVASTLAGSDLLSLVFLSVYCRLPVFVFAAFWLNAEYPDRSYFEIFLAFFAGALGSFPYYLVLPMVGLTVFVGMPPWPFETLPHLEEFKNVVAPPHLARTCLPSMHTTWILMFFFCVKRMSRLLCYVAAAIVVLTLVSTVSAIVGHYTVDILVSTPFCLAFLALSCKSKSGNGKIRAVCVAYGLGSTAIWSLAFRFAPETLLKYSPWFWTLMIAGCVLTFWLESRLAKATFRSMASTSPA